MVLQSAKAAQTGHQLLRVQVEASARHGSVRVDLRISVLWEVQKGTNFGGPRRGFRGGFRILEASFLVRGSWPVDIDRL